MKKSDRCEYPSNMYRRENDLRNNGRNSIDTALCSSENDGNISDSKE